MTRDDTDYQLFQLNINPDEDEYRVMTKHVLMAVPIAYIEVEFIGYFLIGVYLTGFFVVFFYMLYSIPHPFIQKMKKLVRT